MDEAGQLLDAVAARLTGLRTLDAADGAGAARPARAAGPVGDSAEPISGESAEPTTGESAEHNSSAQHPEPADGAPPQPCVGWCPICRTAELLQGDRPEMTAKLVDAALLVVTTLRSLLPPAEAAAAPAQDGAAPSMRSGIERIDIR